MAWVKALTAEPESNQFRYRDEFLRTSLPEVYRNTTWPLKVKFAEAWQRLEAAASLRDGWDSYGAEAPDKLARDRAATVLSLLDQEGLAPDRVLPSAEGGIAFCFVRGLRRADMEVYNSGEIAAATYSETDEPSVWEADVNEDSIRDSIQRIRVHLAH